MFGHQDLVTTPWGMLGNDAVGDCYWAGSAHEHMTWSREAGVTTSFTTSAVLSDYSAQTGYVPGDESTDRGTDMSSAAGYRLKTGVVDAAGVRHRVAAYLALRVGDLNQQLQAAYLFGAVGLGFMFPDYAMDQFNEGVPWDYLPGQARPTEGHYVPLLGRLPNGNLVTVSWGQLQEMTPRFFVNYNDESLTYLTYERLKAGRDLEGFDDQQLIADLKALGHPVIDPDQPPPPIDDQPPPAPPDPPQPPAPPEPPVPPAPDPTPTVVLPQQVIDYVTLMRRWSTKSGCFGTATARRRTRQFINFVDDFERRQNLARLSGPAPPQESDFTS